MVSQPQLSLRFPLPVENGWPPVAVESLPFKLSSDGYTALSSPLFVKDLSVGDVIEVTIDGECNVNSWRHVIRSRRSTIWLLRLKQPNAIDATLAELRALGCNSVGLDSVGCYAVDVPESVSIDRIDSVLALLDEDSVAVAFPSMRHPE